MSRVKVVGIGPGNKNYITKAAVTAMEDSFFIIGFKRAIESLYFIKGKKLTFEKISDILSFILSTDKTIAVAASGDPCFFGIAEYLKGKLSEEIEVVPGISSFQYFTSKLKKSWSYAFTGSMHGREEAFTEKVKENKLSIWLTDNENSPESLCSRLIEEKIKCKLYIGENLSYEDERITIGNPEELKGKKYSKLSVVIVERV